jgi:hypothetical protein
MNIVNRNIAQKVYFPPTIVCIKLDNEIALALESDPVEGPGETSFAPDYFRQEPFKTNFG